MANLMEKDSCNTNSLPSDLANNEKQTSDVKREDVEEFLRTLKIHKRFVYAYGKLAYPEYDFETHDLSKEESDKELVPYTIKFVLGKDGEKNPEWEKALNHHYTHNPHHPEHWANKNMPEEYLKESIIDMVAAKYQYQSGKEELPQFMTADMFDFQPQYLERYTETDREIVEQELHRLKNIDWTKKPLSEVSFPIDLKD